MNRIHEFALTVPERHIDLLGHVNNAAYLEIFEMARWDMVTRNGFGKDEIRMLGIGPVILEVKIRFKRELRAGDRVTIRTRTRDYRSRISHLEQSIELPGGEVACAAEFVIALFDLKTRKVIKPTPEWLRAIDWSEGV